MVARLVHAVNPHRIIFFGSYARGEQTHESDIDIMVIENTMKDQGLEMVRLRKAAGRIASGVGIDIQVYSTEKYLYNVKFEEVIYLSSCFCVIIITKLDLNFTDSDC